MSDTFKKLAAEFPRNAVSWRAQTVTKDGSKALALAYIDSRDVQDRLDEVVGPENWQDRYEVHGAKTICYLSLRVDGEWVTKADGAGDTAVEAEKGSLSDAFKRAAVKWGIGRYLYSLESVWVPCECTEYNGKKQWKRWTQDPWSMVRGHKQPEPISKKEPSQTLEALLSNLARQETHAASVEWKAKQEGEINALSNDDFQTFKAAWIGHLKKFAAQKEAA